MIGTHYDFDNSLIVNFLIQDLDEACQNIRNKELSDILIDFERNKNSHRGKFFAALLLIKITTYDPKILSKKNIKFLLLHFEEAAKKLFGFNTINYENLLSLETEFPICFRWHKVANKRVNTNKNKKFKNLTVNKNPFPT
jgi:hypothetical protein